MLTRLDGEDDHAPEKLQHLLNESDTSSPVGGRDQDHVSTTREEPNMSQLRPTECKHNGGGGSAFTLKYPICNPNVK